MNFDECTLRLQELYHKIYTQDYSENENYETNSIEFNKVFFNLTTASINENKYFCGSPLNLYIIELAEILSKQEKQEIDFDEIEYIKNRYRYYSALLVHNKSTIIKGVYYFIPFLNNENYKSFTSIINRRTNYIEESLFKKGIEVIKTKNNSIPELGWNGSWKISFKRDLKTINQLNEKIKTIQIKKPQHENIFCNNGFVLFEYILTNHIAENRGRINDISFYYWKMYNDKYIVQKPFVFVEWFMNVYNADNFQIKTLENATDRHRPTHYSNALDWFKLQNH